MKYCYRILSLIWFAALAFNVTLLKYVYNDLQWALVAMSFFSFSGYAFCGWKEYKNEV